jgi:hypothetical protein
VAGSDELADWAGDSRSFFLPVDDAIVSSLSSLTDWCAGTARGRCKTPAGVGEAGLIDE